MEKHNAVILAKNAKERYKYDIFNKSIEKVWESIDSDYIVGEYEINEPLLERGDWLHLHELNKTVQIQSRVRSTNNKVTYLTNHKNIVNDDKLLEESLKEAKEKQQKHKNKELENSMLDDYEGELNRIKRKHLWQFWKPKLKIEISDDI